VMDSDGHVARVLEMLKSGNFSLFVGEIEDVEFECKAAPYHLDDDTRQFELAKDVAAFANADGGVIVIGLETSKVPERAADMVKAVRPFAREHFDAQRYRALIDVHVYPRIEGLKLDWHPLRKNSNTGIASILVPRQGEVQQPFLVSKILSDDGKVRGTALGYFERHRDGVDRKDAKDFHYLIRAGRTKGDTDARLAAIEARLDDTRGLQLAAPPASEPTISGAQVGPISPPEPIDRIDEAVSLARLSDRPAYVLAARPLGYVSIAQLFATQQSPVRQLLESPPELRAGGFGIDAGNTAVIVEGRSRRALHLDSNRDLELWRDGTLIFVAPGDRDFLCWGRKPTPPLVINPIVLLESLYLFCTLAQAIQQHTEPKNCGVYLDVELRGMQGDQTLYLAPGPVGSFGWEFGGDRHPAPRPTARFSETWAQGEIDPGLLTFRVATQVYAWFGLTHDRVPYVIGDGEDRRINVEALKKL